MRRIEFYKGKILSKILYAAGAWFLHNPTPRPMHCSLLPPIFNTQRADISFGLNKDALKMLKQIETEALLVIFHAWTRTASELIWKEFQLTPLVLRLHEAAMSHRCKSFRSLETERMRKNRSMAYRKGRRVHPFDYFDKLTGSLLEAIEAKTKESSTPQQFQAMWFDPAKRHERIKRYTALCSREMAGELWGVYQRTKAHGSQGKCFHPALASEWKDNTLKLYKGLDAAQSTILLGMRTGNIGVRTNPVLHHDRKDFDRTCPLCSSSVMMSDHTIKHLFLSCPSLRRSRGYLQDMVKTPGFDTYLSDETEVATAYAIRYFGLEQFSRVRDDTKYLFPRQRKVAQAGKATDRGGAKAK